ncbi:MAG: Arc family DNA-binding protein [Clostridia bacterium]|nr:Arc family DNA-binding protein [Clostridia bacterium]
MAKKNFPLRIDMKLYEVIEAWAADEFRSVNSQIEYILRESARKAGRLKTSNAGDANSRQRENPGENKKD